MDTQPTARLLVRAAAGAFSQQRLALAGQTYFVEPLFGSSAQGPALAAEPTWFVLDSRVRLEDDANPWELAHAAARSQLAFSGAGSVYVEPDLLQQFPYPLPASTALALAAGADRCESKPPISQAPPGPGIAWHLRDEYAGLRAASQTAEQGFGVRIGILDTGYDPTHHLLPHHLLAELGRDFADDHRGDATDPDHHGVLQFPGHGTGTLCILAGKQLQGISLPPEATSNEFYGGAPLAQIVPVRIANSVILFRNSSLARGLDYLLAPADGQPVDVVSISLGGVASAAWANVVNRAYDRGVFIAAAAGNCFSGLPTRNIVYPARFRRVTAVCGAMADYRPYAHLPLGVMEGNYGPPSKMQTALAAFTPNVGWAKLGCPGTIDLDGAGTSAATPQVAATAALWLARHRNAFGRDWQRVEALRKALFDKADKSHPETGKYFGNGVLNARATLEYVPNAADLRKQGPDSASLSFLKVLTGLGVAVDPERQAMFDLELVQLAETSPVVADLLPDLGVDQLPDGELRQFLEVVVEDPRASRDLRVRVGELYAEHFGGRAAAVPVPSGSPSPLPVVPTPVPPFRCLRAYAFDPSLALDLDNAGLNDISMRVPWERLQPGPRGEYLEVLDEDAAGNRLYAPVDLDSVELLAQDGWSPSQDNPQFHQQMVYAVARRTIQHFEEALGRPMFWAGQRSEDASEDVWVPRLKLLPHALQDENAFYSPARKALLFGSFRSRNADAADSLPGEVVFTCLSHDIIAHETTHALLDGLHYRLREPTNPDVLAFHEGFSDVVALFQHFSLPDVLESQVIQYSGELRMADLLTGLARQFGKATGHRGALRSAIGSADPNDYRTLFEPHDRGAILVAAVFDAFLTIYQRRAAEVVGIASAGSGVLPPGKLPRTLARALGAEAAHSAAHVLRVCIRALDYVPPVDLTYGDYLRALTTADYDFTQEDDFGYRLAFVDAFRRRGIYPDGLATLSVESLRWNSLELEGTERVFAPLFDSVRDFSKASRYAKGREALFEASKLGCATIQNLLPQLFGGLSDAERKAIGLAFGLNLESNAVVRVHSLRSAHRTREDGATTTQIVLELTQSEQRTLDTSSSTPPREITFRGGSTLVIDLEAQRIRYAIHKDVTSERRFQRLREYLLNQGLRGLGYFRSRQLSASPEPFRLLHETRPRPLTRDVSAQRG